LSGRKRAKGANRYIAAASSQGNKQFLPSTSINGCPIHRGIYLSRLNKLLIEFFSTTLVDSDYLKMPPRSSIRVRTTAGKTSANATPVASATAKQAKRARTTAKTKATREKNKVTKVAQGGPVGGTKATRRGALRGGTTTRVGTTPGPDHNDEDEEEEDDDPDEFEDVEDDGDSLDEPDEDVYMVGAHNASTSKEIEATYKRDLQEAKRVRLQLMIQQNESLQAQLSQGGMTGRSTDAD